MTGVTSATIENILSTKAFVILIKMATTHGEEKEALAKSEPEPEPVPTPPQSLCPCLLSSKRKNFILSTVARTENYLRERRIPELLRFMLTKIIANKGKNPAEYSEKLIDDCMLFRAGFGAAPVLYEDRHLEAVVKSFDPGQRGWLSGGQVRRAFTTLGLTPIEDLEERVSTDVVLQELKRTQEKELYDLLIAGMGMDKKRNNDSHSISTI